MSFDPNAGIRAILTIVTNHGSTVHQLTAIVNTMQSDIAALTKHIETLDRRIMRLRRDAKAKHQKQQPKATIRVKRGQP